MKSTSPILASLAASASAFTYTLTEGTGIGAYPAQTHIEEANQHPNATISVKFTLGTQSDWTLQMNLTAISVPDAGSEFKDPKIFNAVYGLQWPGHSALNDSILAATQTKQDPKLCVDVVFDPFPANVTKTYKDSDAGSCESALGKDCVEALKHRYAVMYDSCGAVLFNQVPECVGSFVKSKNGAFGFNLATHASALVSNSTTSNSTNYPPLQNGEGFAYKSSDQYSGANSSLYNAEASRLQMVVFSTNGTIVPVCTRIDPKAKTGAAVNVISSQNYLLGAFIGALFISYVL